VLIPRRQAKKLNAGLDFLGEAAEVVLHPDDAGGAGVTDGDPVVVRTDRGELTGVAKVDPDIRRGWSRSRTATTRRTSTPSPTRTTSSG
jgi:anaerobic selenocysteine-containing dehydrogenase